MDHVRHPGGALRMPQGRARDRRPQRRGPVFLTAALALLAGGCEEPIYSDELGLQAVSTAEGSLAGTFVWKSAIVTKAHLPITLGEDGDLAGGETYYLVEREWLAEERRYHERRRICGGRIYDTGGTSSFIPNEHWRLVPDVETAIITVDHARGEYAAVDHAELWAIELDDPVHDGMPKTPEEAREERWAARIHDADDDGKPGMTMTMSGLLEGEVYFCQRKFFHLEGYIVAEDGESLGLVTAEYEQLTLDASSPLLMNQLERSPHPDPKEAWYHMARLPDGAGCDDVISAVEDGVVSLRNPFL